MGIWQPVWANRTRAAATDLRPEPRAEPSHECRPHAVSPVVDSRLAPGSLHGGTGARPRTLSLPIAVCQERPWHVSGGAQPTVTIITDACGDPARLAAFCISEHGVEFTDMGMPDSVMDALSARSDNQIMAQAPPQLRGHVEHHRCPLRCCSTAGKVTHILQACASSCTYPHL